MQSIGERLEEARKRKGVSLREAADATKIRGDYLQKFESNQYDLRLPEIYVRGFLRTYAIYLGLSGDKVISDYKALGVGDEKAARPLNREIYGRMDISVSSAKDSQGGAGGGEGKQENPATFKPAAPVKLPMDRAVLVKAGLVVAGVLILGLVVSLLMRSGGSGGAREPNVVWVKPESGETSMGLVATGPGVAVEVTEGEGGPVLYKGALKEGELRAIPHRGMLIVKCETPENLMVEVRGQRMALKDPKTGQFLKKAQIRP